MMGKARGVSWTVQALYDLAKEYDVEVKEVAKGHFHIKGHLLVSYFPFSKKQSAIVENTVKSKKYVSVIEAIKMSLEPPPFCPADERDRRRRGKSKEQRMELLKEDPHCFWCRKKLSLGDSTIDHRIPFARGGLDNRGNRVLACFSCNYARGHDMKELSGGDFNGNKCKGSSGFDQCERTPTDNVAVEVSEIHSCGIDDASSV